MINSVILPLVVYVYGLAAFCYILSYLFKKEIGARLATWISIIGFAANTTGIIIRWIESYKLGIGHIPLSNQYEFLIFFSWATVLVFLLVERKYKSRLIGAFSMPLAFFAMAYASLSSNVSHQIQPLIPALKSSWLNAHVLTYLIAYAAFTIAFSINCMYLLRPRERGGSSSILVKFPSADILDELTHQLLVFGFPFLLLGIITGSVWANTAWGRFWGWDPKETWSLITCIFYLNTLFVWYFVRRRGWENIIRKLFGIIISILMVGVTIQVLLMQPILLIILFAFYLIIFFIMDKLGVDRRTISAVLSIIAFGALFYTYFGVNLLPGLHSF